MIQNNQHWFAGGMTRLSTGYTFLNVEHSKYIVNNLEK